MADREPGGAWQEWALTPQSREELQALARTLRRAQGTFVLAFARCSSVKLRERLVQALRDALTPAGVTIHEVKLTAKTRNLPAVLAARGGYGDPLFVYGLEAVMPSIAPDWAQAQLNERRGLYQKLGRPLVFWLPEHTLQLVARGAPDFWAWRSGVYEFALRSAASEGRIFHIDTGGGAVIAGDVTVESGDFVGRDKIVQGDEVHGDKIITQIGQVTGSVHTGEADIHTHTAPPRERQEREVVSLRLQLQEARENLLLIRERRSQYVMETNVPLELIKRERQLERQITDLEVRLAMLESSA